MTKKNKKTLLIVGGVALGAGLLWWLTKNNSGGAVNPNTALLNNLRSSIANGNGTSLTNRSLDANSMPASSMPQATSVANFADVQSTGHLSINPATTVQPVTVQPVTVQPVTLQPQKTSTPTYIPPSSTAPAYSTGFRPGVAKTYLGVQPPISYM